MKNTFINLLIDMNIIQDKADVKGSIIDFYLKSATDFVKYYVNKQGYDDSDYEDEFETSIINIAIYLYKAAKDKNSNIQSKTQGSRSITYRGFTIPEDYYKSLPRYPNVWGAANMVDDNGYSCNRCCENHFNHQVV